MFANSVEYGNLLFFVIVLYYLFVRASARSHRQFVHVCIGFASLYVVDRSSIQCIYRSSNVIQNKDKATTGYVKKTAPCSSHGARVRLTRAQVFDYKI